MLEQFGTSFGFQQLRRPARVVPPPGPAITASSGYVTITGLTGSTATVTVTGGNHPGSYTVDLTALAAGPVQLAAVTTSGTIGAGNVLTAAQGLWVGNASDGAILIANQWINGTTVVASNTATYTQTGSEATLGLFVQETAHNAAGSTVGTKVTAIAQTAYTAPSIQSTGTAYLSGSPTWGTVNNSLTQFTFTYDGTGVKETFLCDNTQNLSFLVTTAKALSITQKYSGGGAISLTGPTLAAGDKVNTLIALVSSGTTRLAYQVNGGAWTVTTLATAGTAFALANPVFYLNSNTVLNQFTSKNRGLRHWTNLATMPDVSNATVRGYFYNASNDPQDSSIANTQYGTPVLNFIENAAGLTAGTNLGSGGAFTKNGTGSFADVAP